MPKPRIAVVSFPGNNCEVESMRSVKESGMDALFFRWNDDRSKLKDVDGYFIVGGFAYEDRGRSGMVAARDSLLDFIGQEADAGKVVIGNCNGAQVLVESGLIPLAQGLQMSLARNAIPLEDGWHAPGFLSEWVWITPTCKKNRCASSNWDGVMHLPIAHGEGRFTTKDRDLLAELKKNDQIAFRHCDAEGVVSEDSVTNPNGSQYAIAGICNHAGNVVALMPHPERTPNGARYFASVRAWIEQHPLVKTPHAASRTHATQKTANNIPSRQPHPLELFISSIITNNEERTVEQIARKYAEGLKLTQLKYFAVDDERKILGDLSLFNANKERVFIRRNGIWETSDVPTGDLVFLRRDEPDTGAMGLGKGSETGICYACRGIVEKDVTGNLLEVFCNPHSSSLERMSL